MWFLIVFTKPTAMHSAAKVDKAKVDYLKKFKLLAVTYDRLESWQIVFLVNQKKICMVYQ